MLQIQMSSLDLQDDKVDVLENQDLTYARHPEISRSVSQHSQSISCTPLTLSYEATSIVQPSRVVESCSLAIKTRTTSYMVFSQEFTSKKTSHLQNDVFTSGKGFTIIQP